MTTTMFAAVISRLGLSQSEAAEYLGVRIDTVKKWGAGTNRVPDRVWGELREYARSLEPVTKLIDRAEREARTA